MLLQVLRALNAWFKCDITLELKPRSSREELSKQNSQTDFFVLCQICLQYQLLSNLNLNTYFLPRLKSKIHDYVEICAMRKKTLKEWIYILDIGLKTFFSFFKLFTHFFLLFISFFQFSQWIFSGVLITKLCILRVSFLSIFLMVAESKYSASWPNHASYRKSYCTDLVQNSFYCNMVIIIFDLWGFGSCWVPKNISQKAKKA